MSTPPLTLSGYLLSLGIIRFEANRKTGVKLRMSCANFFTESIMSTCDKKHKRKRGTVCEGRLGVNYVGIQSAVRTDELVPDADPVLEPLRADDDAIDEGE